MRWWQISRPPPYQQPWTQPQWSATRLRLDRETKHNKKRSRGQEAGYRLPDPRLFACHLLDMIITTERGCRGLSRPHLYQQAGIKLSNYPPRPLARLGPWPGPQTLLAEPLPFASLACSQTLQAGMWNHMLMTALFQSQTCVIALDGLHTLSGSGPAQ